MKVSEAALFVLVQAGEPLRVEVLVERMQSHGWVCGGKKPASIVQASLHDFCKRQGTDCPIKFLGNQTFVSAGIAEAKQLPVRALFTKKSTIAPLDTSVDIEGRRCGNCASIEYSGIMQVTRFSGACNNFENSGRPAVQSSAPSCPFWRARSQSTIHSEDTEAGLLRIKIAGVNAAVIAAARHRGK